MPILTVIGGPNGAGKSTLSKDLLSYSGIEAFDYDKEVYAIWSKFSYDPAIEQGAYNRALEVYLEVKAASLQANSDFAFETNFHTSQVLNVVDEFRTAGYNIELIFICLESQEIAIARVKNRVANGGHWVSEETIRERFINGLNLLDEIF